MLKSTEKSTVLTIENPGIQVIEDEDVDSEKIQAKVVKIDVKTLVQTFFCQECSLQVEMENVTA